MDSSPQSPQTNRRHRAKRLSVLRLSTDTTASLPAYSAPPAPRPPPASQWPDDADPPLDEPPDYPQSAEEADREDDFVPLPLSRIRKPRHRRSESLTLPTTTSVDDLLERSVVALELSTNALLQSMNTQSTISSIANDQILERSLERQAILLDMRLKGNRNAHEGWIDDLNDVMNRMDGLLLTSPDAQYDGISRSLPTDSLPIPRKQKAQGISPDQPYLHLTTSSEIDLRDTIRPPRALTQYVSVESSLGDTSELTADARSILLPSTTGLRAAAKLRSFSARGSSPPPLRKALSSPGPERSPTKSTSAYNFLSKLVSGQCSPPPSRIRTSTPSSPEHKSRHGARRYSAGSADGTSVPSSLRRTRSTSRSRSSASASSETISLPPPPPVRAMTPPLEETTPSSSESEQNVQAFRAMQSLRKILDDAPDPKGKRPEPPAKPVRRTFYPRSTPVAPSSGTSMATASVYRLFTKSSHHPSASRPKQSSLKKRPQPSDSLTVPETPHPESQRSSAPSTPRQVSFADLPPEFPGRSWRTKDKGRARSKGKGKKLKDREPEESSGWWKWLMTPSILTPSSGTYEDRLEDKMMKGWGKPNSGGGSVDDWIL